MSRGHLPPDEEDEEFVCLNCQHRGEAEYVWEGSPLVAILLTIFLVVPGVLYIIWQYFNRFPVCAVCGSQRLRRSWRGMDDRRRSRPG